MYSLQGQDTVVISHKYFTSTFIKSKHIPLLVEYYLTKEMLTCGTKLPRLNKFKSDPQLMDSINFNDDYRNSGYDRGHNISARNNSCDSIGMLECFYFSNIFPQTHSLNAGAWKNLENHERDIAIKYDSIKVFIGHLGEIGKLGVDSIIIPEYCWKIIYIKAIRTYECYLMPNNIKPFGDLETYKVDLSEIENRSRICFQTDIAETKLNQSSIKNK